MKHAIRTPVALFCLLAAGYARPASLPLPVRGLHMAAPQPDQVPLCLRFIRDALPKEGVNVLVMEFDYRYHFTSHPDVADPDALSKADVQAIAAAARESGVRLIPLVNLLGHQSWAQQTFGLLRAHPEFDETPGKYPNNQGIYCRSYCPLHPDVHKVVFDLIDELAVACGADAVHVGMDEVFLIGTGDCPRCRGRNRAELFAQEVRTLHDHLAEAHREMWMWGDRLLDGYVTGLGEWEASQNGTAAAINDIPRDIVICDWHYDSAAPTAAYFAVLGFRVVAAPWQKSDVALGELELVRSVRAHANDLIAPRLLGMLQTSWGSSADFVNAYYGAPGAGKQSAETVTTFKTLFSEIRKAGEASGAGSSNSRPGATEGPEGLGEARGAPFISQDDRLRHRVTSEPLSCLDSTRTPPDACARSRFCRRGVDLWSNHVSPTRLNGYVTNAYSHASDDACAHGRDARILRQSSRKNSKQSIAMRLPEAR